MSVWVPGPAWMSSSQGQLPTSFLLSSGQSWHPRAPWGEGGARHDGKEPEGASTGSWHSGHWGGKGCWIHLTATGGGAALSSGLCWTLGKGFFLLFNCTIPPLLPLPLHVPGRRMRSVLSSGRR